MSRWQWWHHLVPWRPSWHTSLTGTLWMKGPQGKCNFPTWRILSTGSEALHDQGIRSAMFQAPPIVCMMIWVEWRMVRSCCCSPRPPSPLPLIYISSLLPCLNFGRSISGTGTAAVHVPTKCQHTCEDSEVTQIKKWVERNTIYWLFTCGK